MPNQSLTEEPLQFGRGGRLFGVFTQPGVPSHGGRELPVFVFLNAGALHRVGPYGLYVRLARNLAPMGFSSLRIDLAGKGDSPAQANLAHSQSVAADYDEITNILESRLGPSRIVLAGLCSGADDAIRCASADQRVVGMLLLDPVCIPDPGFRARAFTMRYANVRRYLIYLKRRLSLVTAFPEEMDQQGEMSDYLALRDIPTHEQIRAAFNEICNRHGRVLSVFTEYATAYYNELGQLGRVLDLDRYHEFCAEIFWPQVGHTYPLELHRRRLIEECKTWAAGFASVHRSPIDGDSDTSTKSRPDRHQRQLRELESRSSDVCL